MTEEDEQRRAEEEEWRRTAKERRRAAEEVDTDGWGEWQGIDTELPKQNIPEAGESESDDRKEEIEAKEEAHVRKAEVELQDDHETDTGDENSKVHALECMSSYTIFWLPIHMFVSRIASAMKEKEEEHRAEEEVDSDSRKKEFEATAGGDIAKLSEDPRAEVEKLQDDREADTGDRNAKEIENIEKVGQERQENEKSSWGTLLRNGPAIIVPQQKESRSFCCGCVVM